jgi:hypothetical protein
VLLRNFLQNSSPFLKKISLTIARLHSSQSIYRFVDKKTFLNWGLTSDWLVSGPRKRRSSLLALDDRSSSNKSATSTFVKDSRENADSDASSEGYGEMTEGSIERLLIFLKSITAKTLAVPLPISTHPEEELKSRATSCEAQNLASEPDPSWNLTRFSSFIDIGSGYGKVVLHAKLSARVQSAVGIEYVASRAAMASETIKELTSRRQSFLNNETQTLLRSGCRFELGDATKYGTFDFSHVYMYDKVFSERTTSLLAKQLNQSSYRVLVSYQRVEVWRRLGLQNIAEIAALTMRTTGGQNFRAYVYIKTTII